MEHRVQMQPEKGQTLLVTKLYRTFLRWRRTIADRIKFSRWKLSCHKAVCEWAQHCLYTILSPIVLANTLVRSCNPSSSWFTRKKMQRLFTRRFLPKGFDLLAILTCCQVNPKKLWGNSIVEDLRWFSEWKIILCQHPTLPVKIMKALHKCFIHARNFHDESFTKHRISYPWKVVNSKTSEGL